MVVAMENPRIPTKLRWGEMDEEDDDGGESLKFLLPPRQVIGPDENGVTKMIDYKFNDDGNRVKVTTTLQTRKRAARLNKRAAERRSSWSKFGDAVNGDVGSSLTTVSAEVVRLEKPRPPGTKEEETKSVSDPSAQLGTKGGAGGAIMVCRICSKNHWTVRCPYQDLLPQPTTEDKLSEAETSGPSATTTTTKGAYVPPSLRAGAADRTSGPDMRRRNDENSVRVTNLSEDAREPDLLELARTFGPVSRVYVALDHKTGLSRGFGFINFVSKDDAQRAINKLNGYGYDNLILRVEWATPRN